MREQNSSLASQRLNPFEWRLNEGFEMCSSFASSLSDAIGGPGESNTGIGFQIFADIDAAPDLLVPLTKAMRDLLATQHRWDGPHVFTTTNGRKPLARLSDRKKKDPDKRSGVFGLDHP
jgi:hypothetical protein